MTVAQLLRGLEPRMFGATPEKSWALRERVAQYIRPSLLEAAGRACLPAPAASSSAVDPTGAGHPAPLATARIS